MPRRLLLGKDKTMKQRMIALALAMLLLAALGCAVRSVPATGAYTVEVKLEGGTGKATIASPARLDVSENGDAKLTVVWSSDRYDYMRVDGERYDVEIVDGHSVFVIPVKTLDKPLAVIADTTAMSAPHEIEYTITFDAASLKPAA